MPALVKTEPRSLIYPMERVMMPKDLPHPAEGTLFRLSGVPVDWSVSWKECVNLHSSPSPESPLHEVARFFPKPTDKEGLILEDLYLWWAGDGHTLDLMVCDDWLSKYDGVFEYAHPCVLISAVVAFPNLVSLLCSAKPEDPKMQRPRYWHRVVGLSSGRSCRLASGGLFTPVIWRVDSGIRVDFEEASVQRDTYVMLGLSLKSS